MRAALRAWTVVPPDLAFELDGETFIVRRGFDMSLFFERPDGSWAFVGSVRSKFMTQDEVLLMVAEWRARQVVGS